MEGKGGGGGLGMTLHGVTWTFLESTVTQSVQGV